jgi:ATP-dependent DNA helicase RecQ
VATGPRRGLCGSLECRHRALSRYFGQDYARESCEACDVCLDEVQGMSNGTELAQKIISCVYRTGQRFGIGYTVQVLRGSDTDAVRQRGHDRISTFGLLRDIGEKPLTNLVYQVVEQGLLERSEGDRPVLGLNDSSVSVLRGQREVKLRDPGPGRVRRAKGDIASWEGVDRELFERLRELRRTLAAERGVPAYVIFGDATLRELARQRPTTEAAMAAVHGIGQKKLVDPGPAFLEMIVEYEASSEQRSELQP